MTKISWTVQHLDSVGAGTDITSRVLSMNITGGREQYLDSYSGGGVVITINNSSNYASALYYGQRLRIWSGDNDPIEFNQYFWIQEITFDDAVGGVGLNTATIVGVDWLARSGRVQANNIALIQKTIGEQLTDLETAILPADMEFDYNADSQASAINYTGTYLNYLNLGVTTERGYVTQHLERLNFVGRGDAPYMEPITTTLGRTISATQIAYMQFERIQNGTQFINKATISSTGLADQTATNSSSLTAYGPAFYSSQTVDSTTTQALGNAEWIVNTFSEPNALRFIVSFSDLAQNSTALATWMANIWNFYNRVMTLNYTVPGGSSTSTNVLVEGSQINVTPSQTTFTLFLSPLTYYQFFTLDSTTLGILDTSRLGW
jgi:hypothetical protein